jgi:hypothetical protein
VFSNQENGFSVARSLTAVGDLRGSIGPPIIVIVFGSFGSLAEAISEIAASTGTVGWQTEITCTSGPRARMKSCT